MTSSATPGMDAVVLAGGRGRRMSGRDKAGLVVDGKRLVDVLLDDLARRPDIRRIVVVTSRPLPLRPGVERVAEDPPFAGPLAAISAGAAALTAERPAEFTAVLAVDAPDSAGLVDDLLAVLRDNPGSDAAVVSEQGRLQPLCALWRTASLRRRLDGLGETRDRPARALFDGAQVAAVPGNGLERDYDTFDELAAYGRLDAER